MKLQDTQVNDFTLNTEEQKPKNSIDNWSRSYSKEVVQSLLSLNKGHLFLLLLTPSCALLGFLTWLTAPHILHQNPLHPSLRLCPFLFTLSSAVPWKVLLVQSGFGCFSDTPFGYLGGKVSYDL